MTICVNTLSASKQSFVRFRIASFEKEESQFIHEPVLIISTKTNPTENIETSLFSLSSNALSKFLEEENEPLF